MRSFLIAVLACQAFLAACATMEVPEPPVAEDELPPNTEIVLLGEPQDGMRLPVIYVFDADRNLHVVESAVKVLQWAEVMPPVLLVGVTPTDRMAEYTPTLDEEVSETSGQSDELLGFIDETVRPYLSRNYPVSEFEVLHGHSLSGLFVLDAMLKEPDRYDGVIAIGPSVWWDQENVPVRASADCSAPERRRVFLSLSNETDSRPGTLSLAASCASETSDGPATVLKEYPREDHVTAVTPATHDGLRYVFAAWNMDPLYEARDVGAIEQRLALLEDLTGGTQYVNVPAFASLGRSFTRGGDPQTAIRLLEQLNDIAPDQIMVLNFLGEAYNEAEDYASACQTLQKSFVIATEKKSPMTRWISRQADVSNEHVDCTVE
ncbi:MAG: hypothetical protein KDA53_12485 [Hyphomonas sp.]|nr:hypothetical protein [Hyphomonas sp.]